MPRHANSGSIKPGERRTAGIVPAKAFKPGQSGNPGGKTREQHAQQQNLAAICRKVTLENIDRLTAYLADKEQLLDDFWLKIFLALADRGFGKPAQAVQHTGMVGSYDLSKIADDKLDQLAAILGDAAATLGDPGGEGAEGGSTGA